MGGAQIYTITLVPTADNNSYAQGQCAQFGPFTYFGPIHTPTY